MSTRRSAPAVTYPTGRSWALVVLHAGVGAMAIAAAGFAFATDGASTTRHVASIGTALIAVAVLAAHVLGTPRGWLRWDGHGWRWADDQGPAARELFQTSHAEDGLRVAVRLDLRGLILLEWRGADGAGGWWWLARSAARASWPALRRALYSPRAEATAARGPAGRRPTAPP